MVAVDKAQAKVDLARALGATDALITGDPRATRRAIMAATDGGADFAFEAVGLQPTIELATASLRRGGTAVLVGLTPFGARPPFDSFRLVDRGQRILVPTTARPWPRSTFPASPTSTSRGGFRSTAWSTPASPSRRSTPPSTRSSREGEAAG
jgi:threonine dehydrogenase-like Zn-dependent dehydrogenase